MNRTSVPAVLGFVLLFIMGTAVTAHESYPEKSEPEKTESAPESTPDKGEPEQTESAPETTPESTPDQSEPEQTQRPEAAPAPVAEVSVPESTSSDRDYSNREPQPVCYLIGQEVGIANDLSSSWLEAVEAQLSQGANPGVCVAHDMLDGAPTSDGACLVGTIQTLVELEDTYACVRAPRGTWRSVSDSVQAQTTTPAPVLPKSTIIWEGHVVP